MPLRASRAALTVALVLSVVFVPFRHRTLVAAPGGGFDFREERVWAPLWRQPAFAQGVAEYPFAWLLGVWGGIALAGAALAVAGRRRGRAE